MDDGQLTIKTFSLTKKMLDGFINRMNYIIWKVLHLKNEAKKRRGTNRLNDGLFKGKACPFDGWKLHGKLPDLKKV
jgi:hypothetical protein